MDPITKEITNWEYVSYYYITQEQRSLSTLDKDNESCSICLEEFTRDDKNIVLLSECSGHYFHDECISRGRLGKNFIKCPNCMKIYGVQTGEMPTGTMRVHKIDGNLPGENCKKIIEINYDVESIIVGGKRYNGTTRTAYLPDTPEGNYALTLLSYCFQRGLTFTLGTSVTTGRDGVIWGIHHKTEMKGRPYGYPDKDYLKRLIGELEDHGVNFGNCDF